MEALANELSQIQKGIMKVRGNPKLTPDASIIVPVNAQGDLENILQLIGDINRYTGKFFFEIILIVNNYPPEEPPKEIDIYRTLGLVILDIPNIRKTGEAPGFSARIPGARAALSDNTIFFDADCRIPNPTVLLDWYIQGCKCGVQAAYTHVDYYDLRNRISVRARIFVHHFARWVKREILNIPTIRGSNYAINRSLIIGLYDSGMLADDMNIGPSVKSMGTKVAYSDSREMVVLTSGRMFSGGWYKLFRYLVYRFLYNIRVLPIRVDAARFTRREKDPIRKYINNVRVK